MLYSFPPNDWKEIETGYADFAKRWNSIMEVFQKEGIKFGLEVHPTEIAYDFVTTRKTLDEGHALVGMNPEIGHMLMGYEDLPYAYGLMMEYGRLAHVHLNSQPLGNYAKT